MSITTTTLVKSIQTATTMKRAFPQFLAILTLLAPASAEFRLAPGESFPVITMPESRTGELMSIADFRGEKLMLQIFASW